MANLQKILVDLPIASGVHVKTAGAKGEKYVYKYTKYFRNADGKPRNKPVIIGKFDTPSGKMIPNGNYYELFNVDPTMIDATIWDYGFSYIVQKCAHDTGLFQCLEEAFGAKALDILVAAAYIMQEGNAMDGVDDWLDRTFFKGFTKFFNSQSVSRLFESITHKNAYKFFTKWVRTALKGEHVCYDVTSVSSYSRTMTDVEYGYNRDKEDLPQFNLGIFVDETTKLPLYYNRYNGSLTDKTNLSFVLQNAKSVGLDEVKFVLDGGFISDDCAKNLNANAKSFTVGIPASLNISEDMIQSHADGIDKYANKLSDYEIYCVEKTSEYYGIAGRLMLFYDPISHAQLCNEMSDRIRLLSAELNTFKRFPKSKLKRYAQYFTITKNQSDNGFTFELNHENIDLLRFRKGFFLIFSTDQTATHDEILYHYRAKDAAEKLFDQMKTDMQGYRVRTHNEQTTDGKTFVTFIALALQTYMLQQLKQYISDNSSSLKKVLNQLSNIMIVTSASGSRFTKAFSKKQKNILEAFDAKNDIALSLASCLR